MINEEKEGITELSQNLTQFETKILQYFKQKEEKTTLLDSQLNDFSKRTLPDNRLQDRNWPFCKKGLHPLSWKPNNSNFLCSLCKEKFAISFWGCLGCKENYCSKCYMPFILKGRCPMDHSMVSILSIFKKCDVCMKTLKMSGFVDVQCGFKLCFSCKEIFLGNKQN